MGTRLRAALSLPKMPQDASAPLAPSLGKPKPRASRRQAPPFSLPQGLKSRHRFNLDSASRLTDPPNPVDRCTSTGTEMALSSRLGVNKDLDGRGQPL